MLGISALSDTADRTPRRTLDDVGRPVIERRASYGAHSPVVGERGEKTRELIVESALREFAGRGFHESSVDDIATGAEVSRATLYQYFESKEALFIELIEESGESLLRLLESLGPLGPTAEGFAGLSAWVTAWTDVFDHFSTVFVEWARVNSPVTPLRIPLDRFSRTHTRRLGRHLVAAGLDDERAAACATVILAVLERANYVRDVYWPGERRRARFVADVAIAFQRYLFPGTPVEVVASDLAVAERSVRLLMNSAVPDVPTSDRLVGLRTQGRQTVGRLLQAASSVFAATGFQAATVEQIVFEAGVARGTFYKYFTDKLDVLMALATDAAHVHLALHDLGELQGRDALVEWLDRLLAFGTPHRAVLRAWTERVPDQADLRGMASSTGIASRDRLATFLINGEAPVSTTSAAMMLMALIEFFPQRALHLQVPSTPAEMHREVLAFVEIGMLGEFRDP